MKRRRFIALLLTVMMVLTMFTGCKSAGNEEESAVSDTYVEGEEYVQSGDKPMKGEESEIISKDDEQTGGEEASGDDEQTGGEEASGDDEETGGKETYGNDKQTGGEETSGDDEETGDEETSGNDKQTGDEETSGDDEETGEEDASGDETPAEGTDSDEDDNADALEGTDPANALKIVAYNVRVANDPNGNSIAERAPRFKMLVDEIQPDILALSEAGPEWIDYIEKNILGTKYRMLYKYRAESSLEAQPLIFDQTKFELVDEPLTDNDYYFWLSETPTVESKGWGGKHYRGATWAKLRVKATGKIFIYYSTHFTGSETATVGSAKLIYKHAIEQGGFTKYPVFLSGDFNLEPWSVGYTELVTNFVDVNDYLGFDKTYTNGGYTAEGGGTHIIDYVMCSPDNVVPTHYEVLHRQYLGGFVSDHKGIYVEATLK